MAQGHHRHVSGVRRADFRFRRTGRRIAPQVGAPHGEREWLSGDALRRTDERPRMGRAADDRDRHGIDHAEPLVVFVGTHDAEERMGGVRRGLRFPAARPHCERYSRRERRGQGEQYVVVPRIRSAAVVELQHRAVGGEEVRVAGIGPLRIAPVAGQPPGQSKLSASWQARVSDCKLERQIHGSSRDHTGRAAQDRVSGTAGACRRLYLGEVMQAARPHPEGD